MTFTYVFMKVTMYMTRGVQIIGWSVSMALMACLTQYSGFSGGNNGAISFLFLKEIKDCKRTINQN